jgi:hypothetical protein
MKMWEIKEYKPLALVFYIDWNWNRSALPLDEDKVPQFKKALEECKMIELEWVVINTFDIKEIRPSQFTTDVEKYFYSRTIAERKYIADKVKRMAGSQKMNVVEEISWMRDWITQMERWIKAKFVSELPEENVWTNILWEWIWKIKTEELTEEQKEQIRTKFKDLQSKLTKQI